MQERNGDKRGKFTEASNREAGIVNLLYGHMRLFRKPHLPGSSSARATAGAIAKATSVMAMTCNI